MDLRSQPGTVLDKVFYNNETFIIQRAGQAKAVLVPIQEYNHMQQIKENAREKLFEIIDEVQQRTKGKEKELQKAIDEALLVARK